MPFSSAKQKFACYNDIQWNGWSLARKERAKLGDNAGVGNTYGLSAEGRVDLMTRWQQPALATRRAD
jgi:hypothetical protein